MRVEIDKYGCYENNYDFYYPNKGELVIKNKTIVIGCGWYNDSCHTFSGVVIISPDFKSGEYIDDLYAKGWKKYNGIINLKQ